MLGSRGLQRLMVAQVCLQAPDGKRSTLNLLINDWVEVQENQYRYLAIDDAAGITIKIVIGEYLACEVKWAA